MTRMSVELACDAMGASVFSASSYDMQHAPSNIIDGLPSTFWLTTGSFPQEIILQLGESSNIRSVDLISTGIRNIELYKCDGVQANSWEKVGSSEADDADGDIQRLSIQLSSPKLTATFLRFKVISILYTNLRVI